MDFFRRSRATGSTPTEIQPPRDPKLVRDILDLMLLVTEVITRTDADSDAEMSLRLALRNLETAHRSLKDTR